MINVESEIGTEETELEEKLKDFPIVGIKRSPIL